LYWPGKEENEEGKKEGKNWKIKGSKEERKGRGIFRYKKLFKRTSESVDLRILSKYYLKLK
jgi:hypothetical protein